MTSKTDVSIYHPSCCSGCISQQYRERLCEDGRAEGLPWDATIVHAGVGLAAGGACRLICGAACLPLLTGHGHGHALYLLRVALVLPRRGLWASVAAVRAHMRPLPILHVALCTALPASKIQSEHLQPGRNRPLTYSSMQQTRYSNRRLS